MADVFISYAREDRPTVETLAEKIQRAGFNVWWDAELRGGRTPHAMAEQIGRARAVVVVWSKHSVSNAWVVGEASEGRDTGRLIPIALEGAQPPMQFRDLQTLDFSRWRDGEGDVFHTLVSWLSRRAAPAFLPGAAKPVEPEKRGFDTRWLLAIARVLVVAAVATTAFLFLN